jgi:hypothetical protein
VKATRGLAVLLLAALLAGCSDETGAIDQLGHNGYDQVACDGFTTLAKEARFGAMGMPDLRAEAAKLATTASHAGDPNVRQAGSQLAAAYSTNNSRGVAVAMTAFQKACTW